jgi:hypothetical protein
MVNDMYAIFESYKQLKEDRADLSGLASGSNLNASINHNNRSNVLTGGQGPTQDYSAGGGAAAENNQEPVSKDIAKILKSLTRCAHTADYSQMLIDCMNLSKLAQKLIKK